MIFNFDKLEEPEGVDDSDEEKIIIPIDIKYKPCIVGIGFGM